MATITAITENPHLEEMIAKFGSSSTAEATLPSSIDFYRFGLVLCEQQQQQDNDPALEEAYNFYLNTLPSSYLSKTIMKDLTVAFQSVLGSGGGGGDDNQNENVINAARSIVGLLSGGGSNSSSNATACQAAYSVDLCVALASAYEIVKGSNDAFLTKALLATFHGLWKHGLIPPLKTLVKTDDEEAAMQQTMELVEALIAQDGNTFLGDALQDGSTITSSIRVTFQEDTPQRDYLLKMMESSASSNDYAPKRSTAAPKKPPAAPKKKVDSRTEIQRRIQQVKDVLPELGEGYIETVLSHFAGDVSRTVAALFDPTTLPPALQLLDTQLPARRQENAMTTTAYHLDDAEAKDIIKERVADMERQQEAVAYALTQMGVGSSSNNNDDDDDDAAGFGTAYKNTNEYDDDYDDQYDGMDAGENLGGTGGTYDDVDIETVRVYNRVARDAESEQAFWNDSRNTNKKGLAPQNLHKKGEKTYRGPNKIKGGRAVDADGKVMARQRGGKKGKTHNPGGQQQTTNNDDSAAATTKGNKNQNKNDNNKNQNKNDNNNNNKNQNKNDNNKNQKGNNQNQNQKGNNQNQNNKNQKGKANKKQAGDEAGGEAKAGGGDKNAELTKIQKRRKNDNKAKLGNHNRKKAAQKKAAGGMS